MIVMSGDEDNRTSIRFGPLDIAKLDELQAKYHLRNRSDAMRYALGRCYEVDVLNKGADSIPIPKGFCAIVLPTGEIDGTITQKILEEITSQEENTLTEE